MRLKNIIFKLFFLILFIIGSYYIIYIETEKYESNSVVKIKDLSQKQSVASLGSIILGQGDVSTKTESEIMSIYIKSYEMFKLLDKDFNLTKYYSSKEIDFLHRLSKDAKLPIYKLDKENLLKAYDNDLNIMYDDLSGTLQISFYHHNPKTAKEIVEKIIFYASKSINKIDKINASTLVDFLKKQEKYYRKKYIDSIKKIISFQNKKGLIDPTINIKTTTELLAKLESDLIKLEVEYEAKKTQFSDKMPEVIALKKQIIAIKKSIKDLKKKLSGVKGTKLNKEQFDFELLKSELEFNKELYRQTLLKLEDAKISSTQNGKNVIVITKPTVAEQYSKPDKVRSILTLLIILIFIYGIISVTISILKEHKD